MILIEYGDLKKPAPANNNSIVIEERIIKFDRISIQTWQPASIKKVLILATTHKLVFDLRMLYLIVNNIGEICGSALNKVSG